MRMRFWENRPISPARSGGILQQVEVHERVAARSPRGGAASARSPRAATAPAAMTKRVSEKPNGSIGRVLRLDPAPGARLQDARGRWRPRPAADRTAPTTSRRGLGPVAGASATNRVMARMNSDEHDLADEHDPPAQLGGGPAAEDGADGDAGAGDAADHRVGDLAVAALEVAGDQRGQRGQHQRRADALEDRPAQGQHRHGRRHRGQRRAARRR